MTTALALVPSTEDPSLWTHPVLDLFPLSRIEVPAQKAKLYITPSTFGESYDEDDQPQPTSAADLPELHAWTMRFAVAALEIWAGRRQPALALRGVGILG